MWRVPKHNRLSTWWWTVDRLTLIAIIILVAIGALLVTTASPAVAERIKLDGFYFVRRQFIFIAISLLIIFSLSLLSPTSIRRLSIMGFLISVIFLVVVLFFGMEAKGARRWLYLGGLSIQPSEFAKPFFIVLTARILTLPQIANRYHAFAVSGLFYMLVVALLILQPDFGMVVTVSLVWGSQLFLAGLPVLWMSIGVVGSIIGVLIAYTLLPHVAERINNFIDPNIKTYQVGRGLEAIQAGGLFGKGPGEGSVKLVLPDSHTDFIFAVAGEEMGLLFTLSILLLYGFITLRSIYRIMNTEDRFITFAAFGLVLQFCAQALINIGVNINILPTKGMTLPLISYGGSSTLAISFTLGMLLALTRTRIIAAKKFPVGKYSLAS